MVKPRPAAPQVQKKVDEEAASAAPKSGQKSSNTRGERT